MKLNNNKYDTMEQKTDDTKEKILAAAATVFLEKGYAATRTRDIATACEVNLALINYHFKSKEGLYHIIMSRRIEELFGAITPILNDPNLSFTSRITKLVNTYMDTLAKEPDLPIFVFGELQKKSEIFLKNIPVIYTESAFSKQLKMLSPKVEPIQYIISIMGMVLVPYIIRPVLTVNDKDNKAFKELLEQRKKLIPVWAKAIVDSQRPLLSDLID